MLVQEKEKEKVLIAIMHVSCNLERKNKIA